MRRGFVARYAVPGEGEYEEGGEMKRSGAKILSERSIDDQSVLRSSSKG